MTQKKEVANWMSSHLMAAIKPKDGSPLKCSSCHTDPAGPSTVGHLYIAEKTMPLPEGTCR